MNGPTAALLDVVDGALDDVGVPLPARQRVALRARIVELVEINRLAVVDRHQLDDERHR